MFGHTLGYTYFRLAQISTYAGTFRNVTLLSMSGNVRTPSPHQQHYFNLYIHFPPTVYSFLFNIVLFFKSIFLSSFSRNCHLLYIPCKITYVSFTLPFLLNPLKTKRRPLYLKTQSVPRCKHFSSRL